LIKTRSILQFEQQILALSLLVYHLLIWHISDQLIHFSFSMVLYGLFLLWQPLWDKEGSINFAAISISVLIAFPLSYFLPKEFLILFGLVLSGLIGSRILSKSTFRSIDLLILAIITVEMAVGVVPASVNQIEISVIFSDTIQTFTLIPILLFLFVPNPTASQQYRNQVDLMHGLLASTMIFIVVLGGIVINYLYGVDYIDGLLLTVFIVATLTIGISWFWNPGVGYSGIGVLWNRYAMTIGGPFESWINTLTTLIEESYLTPAEYLQTACDHLVDNDWLNAVQWELNNLQVSSGEQKGRRIKFNLDDETRVWAHFKSNPGSALEQHTDLLLRMAYQFYLAKLNQEKMRAQEHFATIHHTGARLTHDIKNILQSIKSSLEVLNHGEAKPSARSYGILQNNLTQISQRLESTLEKLKMPNLNTQIKLVTAEAWTNALSIQYQSNSRVSLSQDIDNDIPIPVDLFDSVIENLINNALKKTEVKTIEVRLLLDQQIILLSVCDDGQAIKQNIEENLFRAPVSSGGGMGIGLYQSAIMARAFNFELELSQNEDGRVCFNLFQQLVE